MASSARINCRPRFSASMRMRPISIASNVSTVTCDVKALVEATPISGPACK